MVVNPVYRGNLFNLSAINQDICQYQVLSSIPAPQTPDELDFYTPCTPVQQLE